MLFKIFPKTTSCRNSFASRAKDALVTSSYSKFSRLCVYNFRCFQDSLKIKLFFSVSFNSWNKTVDLFRMGFSVWITKDDEKKNYYKYLIHNDISGALSMKIVSFM